MPSAPLVTIEPCDPVSLSIGDIVLVRVQYRNYLHLVKAIKGDQYLIGNNRGGNNGWVGGRAIFSRATRVA